MTKNDNAVEENPGIGVFSEIKESEKNAEQIIEKSKRDAEEIMNSAKSKASSMILDRFEEIENEKRKRVENFESKVYVLKDTKIDEAKEKTEKIIQKMRKNCDDACDLVFNRFLDNIKNSN